MENLGAQINSELIEGFCRNWNIREFSLFGSVLGEKFNNTSDIDVMVSFGNDADWSLLDHVTMRNELVKLLGRDVDLVTRKGVERSRNAIRRKAILETARVFYATA